MKSRFCAAAAVLAILILSFAGCGGEERRETPAPTGGQASKTGTASGRIRNNNRICQGSRIKLGYNGHGGGVYGRASGGYSGFGRKL